MYDISLRRVQHVELPDRGLGFGSLCRVLPPRVNEVIGVSHMKAIISDNDVLMTGANLSSDYFTMRQVTALLEKQAERASLLHFPQVDGPAGQIHALYGLCPTCHMAN